MNKQQLATAATQLAINLRLRAGMKTYLHDMYTQYFSVLYGDNYLSEGNMFDQSVRENFILDTDENGVVYIKGKR